MKVSQLFVSSRGLDDVKGGRGGMNCKMGCREGGEMMLVVDELQCLFQGPHRSGGLVLLQLIHQPEESHIFSFLIKT